MSDNFRLHKYYWGPNLSRGFEVIYAGSVCWLSSYVSRWDQRLILDHDLTGSPKVHHGTSVDHWERYKMTKMTCNRNTGSSLPNAKCQLLNYVGFCIVSVVQCAMPPCFQCFDHVTINGDHFIHVRECHIIFDSRKIIFCGEQWACSSRATVCVAFEIKWKSRDEVIQNRHLVHRDGNTRIEEKLCSNFKTIR